MSTEKDELIDKLAHARGKLNAALDRITPGAEIYPDWKLKQLLDHITGWDELVTEALHLHARGEQPPLTVKHGIDRYNEASVSQRTQLSLEQSRQAYAAARETFIQALGEMPDEKLPQSFRAPWGGKCSVSSVVRIFVSHELEHARQMDESLRLHLTSV